MAVFDADRRLRVAALFSGGASGVRYLAEHDPNYGEGYAIVGGFSDDPDCPGVEFLESEGIPVETEDIEAFHADRGLDVDDLGDREAYDARTRELLDGFDPDVLLLSGYMWILTAPVVEAYPTVNVHPADLAVVDEGGERVYTGADPVFDAVAAGEEVTRSSVHFVTAEVDAGPILVRSRPFAVHRDLADALDEYGAEGALEEYASAHQEWMKWEGDGPAIAEALALIADGRVERRGATVLIDGEPGYRDLGG